MKTVYILRHGKAEDLNPHGDKSRNLSVQGQQQVKTLLPTLHNVPSPVDIVLCSTADRTRQTLDAIEKSPIFANSEVRHDDSLYNATAEHLLATINALPEQYDCVLLVGHNPGVQELAMALSGTGDDIDLSNLSLSLPTCGFAAITFGTANTWPDVMVASGDLEVLWVPQPAASSAA